MQQYQKVIITSIHEETPGVKTFVLSAHDGSAISYTPGQFITLVFDHHGKEERRSFSISSSLILEEPLSFTVKRIDNGAYSRLLTDRARVGDELFTTGVAGLFTLPAEIRPYKQVFFFAAGIGITPIISLVKTLLASAPDVQVVLIYSNRSAEETVFFSIIAELRNKYPANFKVEFLYSTSFNLSRARLNKALLQLLLKENSIAPLHQTLCYICGPFDYMRMVTYGLEEAGIGNAQIRKENFNTNDRAIQQQLPNDTGPHNVTIRFRGREYTFAQQYPETILQAAKKQGIPLPYSCEVGRCGSCAARCTRGKVWLSYNEVLMDIDLQHGSILTCVGYPIGGDVYIEA